VSGLDAVTLALVADLVSNLRVSIPDAQMSCNESASY
jgi:hypothetical protein